LTICGNAVGAAALGGQSDVRGAEGGAPYRVNMAQDASVSDCGADRHEVIARLVVIMLFLPDFLAPGKCSVHG